MNPRVVFVAAIAAACFATVRAAAAEGPEASCTRASLAGLPETPGEAAPMNVIDSAWACLEHLEKDSTWRVLYNQQVDEMFMVVAEGFQFESYRDVEALLKDPSKFHAARERFTQLPVREEDFQKFCRPFEARGAGGKYADWLEAAARVLNNPELVDTLVESSLHLERIVLLRDFCKILVQ